MVKQTITLENNDLRTIRGAVLKASRDAKAEGKIEQAINLKRIGLKLYRQISGIEEG